MFKKCFLVFVIIIFFSSESFAYTSDDCYDLMVGLNNCIWSINNILYNNANRVTIEQEYNNILNNFNFNIRYNEDLSFVYRSLLDTASRVMLDQKEKDAVSHIYDNNVKKALYNALGGIHGYGGDATSFLLSAALSASSSYFNYKEQLIDYKNQLIEKKIKIDSDAEGRLRELQNDLFQNTWSIADDLHILDKYILRNNTILEFKKALEEKDSQKKIRLLKYIENSFEVFPPYWYYLGKSYQELNNDQDALEAYRKFLFCNRKIYRYDPYLPLVLLNVLRIDGGLEKDSKISLLKDAYENTQSFDWPILLAEAVEYYELNQIKEAKELVQRNIDNGYEVKLHAKIMESINKGEPLNKDILAKTISFPEPKKITIDAYDVIFNICKQYRSKDFTLKNEMDAEAIYKINKKYGIKEDIVAVLDTSIIPLTTRGFVITKNGIYFSNRYVKNNPEFVYWVSLTQDDILLVNKKIMIKRLGCDINLNYSDADPQKIYDMLKKIINVNL